MSSVTSEPLSMDATRFQHTPYYCEENVYLLCKTLIENAVADETGSDLFVVFISNEKKQVPLWHQKASRRADGIVLWDYHVICVQVSIIMQCASDVGFLNLNLILVLDVHREKKKESGSEPLVWDLDSTLPFPSPLTSYVTETVQPSFQLYADYQRFFRIVHAPLFFKHFASDRRHMKEPDGSWTAQPPPYEPIVAQDGILHNLSEYIAMSGTNTLSNLDPETVRAAITQKLGLVVGHTQLQDLFTKLP